MLAKLSNNSKTEEFYERLNSLYLDVSDAIDEFKKEFSNDSVDLSRIDYLSNEISRMNVLKRKYNTSNLLEVKNKLIADIDLYNNYEIELSKIDKLVKEAYEKVYNEAIKVSKIRKDNAKLLSKDVEKRLKFICNEENFDFDEKGIEINKIVSFDEEYIKKTPINKLDNVEVSGRIYYSVTREIILDIIAKGSMELEDAITLEPIVACIGISNNCLGITFFNFSAIFLIIVSFLYSF